MSATRHVFENGLTLLVEPLAQVHSVAIGVFVRRGSRHEGDAERGLAHFIEHLVFKGTASRSAEQIAMDVDAMGGHMDAFTSKEYAAFHLRVLDTHVNKSAEILADILVHPRFDKSDLAKEKTVILEEFAMVDDTPDDILGEMFAEKLWPDHPIGRPILGTRKALRSYTQDDVRRFFKKVYVPANLVLSIAGRITEKKAIELATRLFGALPRGRGNARSLRPTTHHGLITKHKKTLAQTHICLGALGPLVHPRRSLHRSRSRHRPRRQHLVAPLPERPREARPRVLDLRRTLGLHGHGKPVDLRRHREGTRGHRALADRRRGEEAGRRGRAE
jgi:predicted Zn-dependent peptidase